MKKSLTILSTLIAVSTILNGCTPQVMPQQVMTPGLLKAYKGQTQNGTAKQGIKSALKYASKHQLDIHSLIGAHTVFQSPTQSAPWAYSFQSENFGMFYHVDLVKQSHRVSHRKAMRMESDIRTNWKISSTEALKTALKHNLISFPISVSINQFKDNDPVWHFWSENIRSARINARTGVVMD